MPAAALNSVLPKKRKVSDDLLLQQEPLPKKKSPLFNQPQNRYAPPSFVGMTAEEISEWRKEQRRERNRESAAASRNKTRARIEELEGEVDNWKSKYFDMENKMRQMERQIELLTKLCNSNQVQDQQQGGICILPPQMVISHPNSPTSSTGSFSQQSASTAIPNTITSLSPLPFSHSSHLAVPNIFLPPLFSESLDHSPVELQEAATSPAAIESGESSKHIISISRPA